MKIIGILLLLGVQDVFAKNDFDHIAIFENCKVTMANISIKHNHNRSLESVKGDDFGQLCKKTSSKMICTFVDLKNGSPGDTVGYDIILDTKDFFILTSPNKASQLRFNLKTKVASSSDQLFFAKNLDLSGTKVCTGRLMTQQELKKLLKK